MEKNETIKDLWQDQVCFALFHRNHSSVAIFLIVTACICDVLRTLFRSKVHYLLT